MEGDGEKEDNPSEIGRVIVMKQEAAHDSSQLLICLCHSGVEISEAYWLKMKRGKTSCVRLDR